MSKAEKVLKIITVILITILLTFLVTMAYVYNVFSKKELADNTLDYMLTATSGNQFTKLKSVYALIQSMYYKESDAAKLEDAAIAGMLNGLEDPYTYYMSSDVYDEFNTETMGTYEGVGIYIKNNTELNVIEVISPVKNSPAFEAGIQTGDYITAVNGVTYTGEQMHEATTKMKGPEGTEVTITFVRDGKPFDKTIKRESIDIEQVEYEVLSGNIGYINIILFDENVSDDFKKAYDELVNKNVKGIIIDVRDNPGGILSEVVNIADLLVPEGIIVYTVDKSGTRTDYESDATKTDLPIIVLTNESSASASEILAAAVQDHGIGKIVGKTTYGKGLVQKVYNLNAGAAIKMTTSEYFTPNGNKINGIGVIPDVEVELGEDESKDLQLDKAIELLK